MGIMYTKVFAFKREAFCADMDTMAREVIAVSASLQSLIARGKITTEVNVSNEGADVYLLATVNYFPEVEHEVMEAFEDAVQRIPYILVPWM